MNTTSLRDDYKQVLTALGLKYKDIVGAAKVKDTHSDSRYRKRIASVVLDYVDTESMVAYRKQYLKILAPYKDQLDIDQLEMMVYLETCRYMYKIYGQINDKSLEFRYRYYLKFNTTIMTFDRSIVRVMVKQKLLKLGQRFPEFALTAQEAGIIEGSIYEYSLEKYCESLRNGVFTSFRVNLATFAANIAEDVQKQFSTRAIDSIDGDMMDSIICNAFEAVANDPKYADLVGKRTAKLKQLIVKSLLNENKDMEHNPLYPNTEITYGELIDAIANKLKLEGKEEAISMFVNDLYEKIEIFSEGIISAGTKAEMIDIIRKVYKKNIGKLDFTIKLSTDPNIVGDNPSAEELVTNAAFKYDNFYNIYRNKWLEIFSNLDLAYNDYLLPFIKGKWDDSSIDRKSFESFGIVLDFELRDIAYLPYYNPIKQYELVKAAIGVCVVEKKWKGIPVKACPKCAMRNAEKAHYVAYASMYEVAEVQLRSADEPATVYYQCKECDYVEKTD